MILRFLRGNWTWLLPVAAALLLWWRLDAAQDKLADARELIAVHEMRQRLDAAQIAQQNAGIDALVAQRGEDREAYLAGIRAANKQAIKLDVHAAELLRLPSPATRDEQCTAAEQLLRQELTNG